MGSSLDPGFAMAKCELIARLRHAPPDAVSAAARPIEAALPHRRMKGRPAAPARVRYPRTRYVASHNVNCRFC